MRGDLVEVSKLLAVASLAAFAFVLSSEADEIYFSDLVIFLAATVLILLTQIAALVAIGLVVRRLSTERIATVVTGILAVLVVAANAYFMSFNTLMGAKQNHVFAALAFGAIFAVIVFWRRLREPALFILSAYVCLAFGLHAYTRFVMAHPAEPPIKALTIHTPRNVYVIGMESLHSPKAFRELYRVKTLPHVDWLKAHNFRVLDSAYSADVNTLSSYSRMFEFGREISLSDIATRLVFNTNNSTFATFSKSKYTTQFMYVSAYFQLNRSLVSYSFPPHGFHACRFAPKSYFYFVCRQPVVAFINRTLFAVPTGVPWKSRFDTAMKSGKPWFTFWHVHYPFHTPPNYDYTLKPRVNSFKHRMRGALPKIGSKLEVPIGHVLTKDPRAIVVVLGDHGAMLTRGASPDVPNNYFSPKEIVEDRFGVMLAIHPADFCRNRISEGSSTTFLLENIILCLNGDDTPTLDDRIRNRTIFWAGRKRSVDELLAIQTPPDQAAARFSAPK